MILTGLLYHISSQDNAPAQTARLTRNWFHNHGFNLLQHPPKSPDLDPIEHYWDYLQTSLDNFAPRPTNAMELVQAVQQVAAQVPRHFVDGLVASMHRRCQAVAQNAGGHTRY